MHHASPSACPTVNSRPSILGIWRLGQCLHQSDVAELCLAQPADAVGNPRFDYVLKRAVAADHDLESRRQIQQFHDAANSTNHPNLVAVLDASVIGSAAYVVMPRLDGATMAAHLESAHPVALPVALWWTRQIAQGLSALHAAGWVHQDVKPENVIISTSGHATLVDLGFAAKLGEIPQQTFRGTTHFAAPESLIAQEPIHPAVDIFSLGRVLWSWTTRVQTVSDQLLAPVAELVEQMVADEPQQRPTAESVSRQLLRLEIESLGCHIGPQTALRRVA